MLNKISIGTANFSNKYYGIRKKKLSYKSISKIRKILINNKLNYFDTAYNYRSNKIIKKLITKNSEFTFKIPKLSINNIDKNICNKLDKFLNEFKIKKVDLLMFHNPRDFFNKKKVIKIRSVIDQLKKKNLINRFGISIYSPLESKKIIKNINPDVLQIPFNVFDKRFLEKNTLSLIKKRKILLHSRSIFLQGLLLEDDISKFHFKKQHIKIFREYIKNLKKIRLSNLEGCINFIRSKKKLFEKIIIGFDDEKQLKEIISCFKKKKLRYPNIINCDDIKFLEPRRWKK